VEEAEQGGVLLEELLWGLGREKEAKNKGSVQCQAGAGAGGISVSHVLGLFTKIPKTPVVNGWAGWAMLHSWPQSTVPAAKAEVCNSQQKAAACGKRSFSAAAPNIASSSTFIVTQARPSAWGRLMLWEPQLEVCELLWPPPLLKWKGQAVVVS